jgi:metallo-beta-lactamase class B
MELKEIDMKRHILNCLLIVMLILPLCAQKKIELGKDVEIYRLAPGIWRHVTYKEMEEWGRVPANGLIVIDQDKAIMVDTPWTPEQTAVLLDWVEKNLKAKVEAVIVSHSHVDCLGGLPEIHKRGITSIGLKKTRELALAAGVEAPKRTFTDEYKINVGKKEVELYYPGPGHTDDNIVTWIADEKVLFGGCLVKAGDATNLGNTAEADLAAWPATLTKVKSRYPQARLVVPGHGDPGGPELIDHTLELLKKTANKFCSAQIVP